MVLEYENDLSEVVKTLSGDLENHLQFDSSLKDGNMRENS
jgi:hypothetical protein